jgi:hypothetical protein
MFIIVSCACVDISAAEIMADLLWCYLYTQNTSMCGNCIKRVTILAEGRTAEHVTEFVCVGNGITLYKRDVDMKLRCEF